MFSYFENRINPFPEGVDTTPPKGFIAFCLHYSIGVWPWVLVMSFLGAFIAIVEVTLFGFIGSIVDWLTAANREGFLQREASNLFWMGFLLMVARSNLNLPSSLNRSNKPKQPSGPHCRK